MERKIASGIMLTLLLTSMLTLAFNVQPVKSGTELATSTVVVYVYPENNAYGIDETFTIDVVVADVANLYGVDIRFSWDPTTLEYVSHKAKIPVETYPDGILHRPGTKIRDIVNPTEGTYWLVAGSYSPAPSFNGTGTAFNMTFTVLREEACYLHFTSSQLAACAFPSPPITHEVRDGNFWSTPEPSFAPIADFTFSPDEAFVNRTIVTINASTSYDPDGGNIANYVWDFGDGTSNSTIDNTTTHSFQKTGCEVTLTVEDDEDSLSVPLTKHILVEIYRDISITSVQVPPQMLHGEEAAINVTVSNLGDMEEGPISIDTYYNETAVDPANITATEWVKTEPGETIWTLEPAEEQKKTFSWDTIDVTLGVYYYIMAIASGDFMPNDVNVTNNVRLSSTPIYITSARVTIDVDPDTLNLKSKGKWITAYIELPEGYDVNDVDVSTILLNDTIRAEMLPTNIGDYDSDGIPDLMVKFDRAEVISYIQSNIHMTTKFMTVTLTVTGQLNDDTPFEGSDTIRVTIPSPGGRGSFSK